MEWEVSDKIKGLASIANPTDGQIRDLIAGWEAYFTRMQIAPDEQMQEFDGIMRARVYCGSISVVAPSLDREAE